MARGTVKMWDGWWGIITPDGGGGDVLVSGSDLPDAIKLKTRTEVDRIMAPGTVVEFEYALPHPPRGINVRIVEGQAQEVGRVQEGQGR